MKNKHKMIIEKVRGGFLPHKYIVGYFCQELESLPNDGLTCHKDVGGLPEKIREKHLSPVCKTKEEAIKRFQELNE